jgi:hypothetical protein
VPFETDIGLVKRIVEIGMELMTEAELGLHIIKALESLGVIRMEEYSMVLGVKCTTKPDEGGSSSDAKRTTESAMLSPTTASPSPIEMQKPKS